MQSMNWKMGSWVKMLCGVFGLILLFGCSGGQGDDPESESEVEASSGRKPWNPLLGTAGITGVVRFTGKVPRIRPINLVKDKACLEQHPQKMFDNSLLLNEDKTIREVFVWVEKGLEGWS